MRPASGLDSPGLFFTIRANSTTFGNRWGGGDGVFSVHFFYR